MQEVFNFLKVQCLDWGDFIENPSNEDAINYLKAWPNWMTTGVVIYGDKGVGKTHLLNLWKQSANARDVHQGDFCAHPRAIFEHSTNFVFDDCDLMLNHHANEQWMFDFLNIAKEKTAYFLMSSKNSPIAWDVCLNDLKSRLRSLGVVHIKSHDDALLFEIAKKIAKDFDVFVPDDALNLLLCVIERDVTSIVSAISLLDKLSLQQKKPITVQFIKRAFLMVDSK